MGVAMRTFRYSFDEFADAIQTVENEAGLQKVAGRFAKRLGFQWFAYLNISADAPSIISSYPSAWTSHYVESGYQQLDPVVRRARHERRAFAWNGRLSGFVRTAGERRFFGEAATFGVQAGLTVPVCAGFGRTAAFTLAADDRSMATDDVGPELNEIAHTAAVYFHAHAAVHLLHRQDSESAARVLSQRERQCLNWTAQGKTAADIAVLIGISHRTVVFHLENVRIKLGCSSIAQCVAEAMRRGLLS